MGVGGQTKLLPCLRGHQLFNRSLIGISGTPVRKNSKNASVIVLETRRDFPVTFPAVCEPDKQADHIKARPEQRPEER